MKKVVLLACLVFGFNLSNAQLINSYGFKAGCCIADQDFDYSNDDYSMDTQNRYGLSNEL